MKPDLTPTMKAALRFAREHGFKLVRHPGGHWSTEPFDHHHDFGTSTVEGLVRRGRMHYSQWKDGKHGRWPVEATMTCRVQPGGDCQWQHCPYFTLSPPRAGTKCKLADPEKPWP